MSLPQFWRTYITSLHTYKVPDGFPWASQSPFSLFKPGQTMASYPSRPSSKLPVNGSIWVPQTLHSVCVTAIILESCTFLSSLPPQQAVTTLKAGTGPQWLHHPQHCLAQGQNSLHSCAHMWCYPLRRAMAPRKLSPRERLWCCRWQSWKEKPVRGHWNSDCSITSPRCQAESYRIWCVPFWVSVLLWSDLSLLGML